MANANGERGERRVRPRIAPPDHVSPLVPWKPESWGWVMLVPFLLE